MTVAVIVLGLAVLLLGLLVAGLLRSHAEILRSLHELGIGEDGPATARSSEPDFQVRPGVALPRGEGATAGAAELVGNDPWGAPRSIAIGGTTHRTLLMFLSSGCLTCADFWEAFDDPGSLGLRRDIRPVIVTKGADQESEARIRQLAPADVPVVMTTDAWSDYEVPVAPYAILVDGATERILGEGASASWDQVRALMHQALADVEAADEVPGRRRRGATGRRDADTDAELLAAGITPGHPSLYGDAGIEADDSEPAQAEGEER